MKYPAYEYVEVDTQLLRYVLSQHGIVKQDEVVFWGKAYTPHGISFSREGTVEPEEIITYQEFAKMMGVTYPTFRDIFSRGRTSYYLLDDIACYLGYHPTLFIRGPFLVPEHLLEDVSV